MQDMERLNVVAQSNWVEGAELAFAPHDQCGCGRAQAELFVCRRNASVEVLALLLAHPIVQVNSRDAQGDHALVMAVTGEPLPAIRTLEGPIIQ